MSVTVTCVTSLADVSVPGMPGRQDTDRHLVGPHRPVPGGVVKGAHMTGIAIGMRRSGGRHAGGVPRTGQFLAMTGVFMTMFLALAGLVADGGHYFDAKQAAASEAEQAARAGAGSLDVSELHAGTVALDPATAVTAAENYMTAAGQPGTAWVAATPSTPRSATGCPPSSSASSAWGASRSVTESATDVSGITTGG